MSPLSPSTWPKQPWDKLNNEPYARASAAGTGQAIAPPLTTRIGRQACSYRCSVRSKRVPQPVAQRSLTVAAPAAVGAA